ncbi:MAG: LacI family transcriptional regulator [Pseudobutyrivibrio sp.]|uniref:LacI family transcriptional regulator n=2 Tax=Pseudobutyrivibrio TaxID=46205 RepID=A0A2G3E9B5_9FIRM|nr:MULTISPECIES: substrate-binding domain-containing protein [Pseudobutyrivibrio]MBE5903304.1 LacI family transcriptional regulator [Pseudobutyrivibrio sp.]NEX00894.1 substrate-binding domain-containing protein [Pseudobutyrivibrio xylanivorans]PHU39908.1 LacI family transcriptional regulator [Pseudobutyrivibrio ruminis]SFR63543.1 ribose transport system substrate-binding protein [Pseudobutyrivibrio sp. NOR37]
MRKRVLATLMTAAMAATLFAGCGDSAGTDTTAAGGDTATATEGGSTEAAGGDYKFEIIVKSYQSSYWQAAVKGIEQEAEAKGVTVNCTGPNAESDIADQVNMLNNAINNAPNGIGLAACDQDACLDALQAALDAGIPVVCFDSGIPNAPAGSVVSTVATDNYSAGATAAENLYPALKDKIGDGQVRVGEVNQEATSESIINRGLGFIDKFAELAKADGYTVAVVGNEKYVNDSKAETVSESEADIVIEVAVPAQTTVELCATEASAIMNKSDTIGMFGSNQIAAEGILTANENLGVLGDKILAAGFDAGSVIKSAVANGTMYGAVTQSPLVMGITTVDVLCDAAAGKSVSDVPTDGYWYNADNMEDPEIAPNLYD